MAAATWKTKLFGEIPPDAEEIAVTVDDASDEDGDISDCTVEKCTAADLRRMKKNGFSFT